MGQAVDEAGNIWEVADDGTPVRMIQAAAKGQVYTLPQSPKEQRQEARQDRQDARADATATRAASAQERQATVAERTASNMSYDNLTKLRSAWDSLPPVKEYRVAVSQLASGLRTDNNATGDNALIYAYAKAMDPGSVVRESEMGMAASGASVFDSTVANLKKQFGVEGGGQLPPEIRDRLRREMINKVGALNEIYNTQRHRFIDDAKAFGFDPVRVVGKHDGDAYRDAFKAYDQSRRKEDAPPATTQNGVPGHDDSDPRMNATINSLVSKGQWGTANEILKRRNLPPITLAERNAIQAWQKKYPGVPYKGANIPKPAPSPGSYQDSYVGQGMSGVNEGIANAIGAPVDLMTGIINAGTGGINALANTNIPQIENPTLGSQWIKDIVGEPLGDPFIFEETEQPSKQFVRRVGESVGAAALPAGTAGSLGRAGAQLLAGAAGGVGAATAQHAFPDSPLAEMAGEALGGYSAARGIMANARRQSARAIRDTVPTVPELKDQAGQLYRAAESRGVVADPVMTQQLSDNFRAALQAEGRISPTGRISEVYPKAREAVHLIDDYAGHEMNPTQIQNVRQVVGDALTSAEPAERRLGSILTDVLDQWADPIAPELSEARDVASRYLTTEQLQRARELAGARASQFTGSGFENALRTEYRGLDRANIKGNARFNQDVGGAIETVARGTPTSNFFRGLGRLAPTGPVSGMGSMVPALAVGSATSPSIGAAVGGTMAGLGIAGRAAATHMGIKAADEAELIARNGGALPDAQIPPELYEALKRWGLTAAAANYSPK